MSAIRLNEDNFNRVRDHEGVSLLDFYADWCGPCRMFAPTFDEFAGDHPEIECVKIDVDQHGEIAKRYGIMSIPTIMLFKNGELVKKNVGTLDLEELEDFAL